MQSGDSEWYVVFIVKQCELVKITNQSQHIFDHTVRDGASNYFMQSGGGERRQGIEKK